MEDKLFNPIFQVVPILSDPLHVSIGGNTPSEPGEQDPPIVIDPVDPVNPGGGGDEEEEDFE